MVVRRWKRAGAWLASAVAAVGLLAVAAVLVAPPVVQELLYDSRSSGVPCGQLPTAAAVRSALERNADLVRDIQAVGDQVSVVASSTCDGDRDRTEIVVFYPGGDDRENIQELLRERSFGVPVSLRNV